MSIQFLDLLDVIEIHQSRIEIYGGTHGIRDRGLLESAIAQPQATFGGEPLHKDIYEMAAAYLFHIVQNHPFLDGNKRTALATALVFLDINGIEIDTPPNELEEITMGAAAGKVNKERLAQFFRMTQQK
jgi:death on curing protein